jgi:dolichyl-phosphate beta-glucosyltransferase
MSDQSEAGVTSTGEGGGRGPRICVAIPAYNEAERLPKLVEQLTRQALLTPEPSTEFIISDDGSAPSHTERQRECMAQARASLEEAGSPHAFRYVLAERNQGKGGAIINAWRQASPGVEWLAFLDADGSVGAGEFFRLARLAVSSPEVDVVAGSRVKMAGRTVHRHLYRHLQGRVFATVAEQLFQLGFYDTQCGVKLLRASLLQPLLGLLQERNWLLDIELLTHARRRGARAVEVPIDWLDYGGSKVRFGVDAVRMLWGLLRMRYRLGPPGAPPQ